MRFCLFVLFSFISFTNISAANRYQEAFQKEQQTVFSCIALTNAMKGAQPDQLKAASLTEFVQSAGDVNKIAVEWFIALGATKEQIQAATAESFNQIQSLIAGVGDNSGATSSALVPLTQSCMKFYHLVSKDQCKDKENRTANMPRIPLGNLNYAKICREDHARVAEADMASHVKGNPEAEADFNKQKTRSLNRVNHYDRLLKGQAIPQCPQWFPSLGRYSDAYKQGNDKYWNPKYADSSIESLTRLGIIDYQNSCSNFEKYFDKLDRE